VIEATSRTPAAREVTAAILCGGQGTRLRPRLLGVPKALAEVADRPFLAHVLDRVSAAGVRRAVLCTGYGADSIEDAFGPRHAGLDLTYSRESTPMGTGGALRLAVSKIETQVVLAMNGDSLCDASLAEFLENHLSSGDEASLQVVQVEDARRFGRVTLDDAGRVLRFEEKSERPGPAWINAGVYAIARSRLEDIPEGVALSFERDVLPAWIGRGLRAVTANAGLIDIGTPESYDQAVELFGRAGTDR
jgi:NDP-sugar pyrophosphorylase family protein